MSNATKGRLLFVAGFGLGILVFFGWLGGISGPGLRLLGVAALAIGSILLAHYLDWNTRADVRKKREAEDRMRDI